MEPARRARGTFRWKRAILWTAGILVAAVIAVALAFWLSPWPSVAIIARAFAKGDQASEAALAKHVPPGVITRQDIAYGAGADERLDVNYLEKSTAALPTIVWVNGGAWIAGTKEGVANYLKKIGRASCRERVCLYV